MRTFVQFFTLNTKGEVVKVLAEGNIKAGSHNFKFNGTNLHSGTYFYQMITPKKTFTNKMILIK